MELYKTLIKRQGPIQRMLYYPVQYIRNDNIKMDSEIRLKISIEHLKDKVHQQQISLYDLYIDQIL